MNENGMQVDQYSDLDLLCQIEQDPDISQANLARKLGVAVGTINWHLKRLIDKGYVKVKRAQRKKLRYIITPEGISLRARLTVKYVRNSFHLYRQMRSRVLGLLAELHNNGHKGVCIQGKGDIAEVCRLTCLEQAVEIVDDPGAPRIIIEGLDVKLEDGESAGKADLKKESDGQQ